MANKRNTCSKCGANSIVKGDIGLRTSRDLELIMVVRKDHGVEKKVPLQPNVCGKCGYVDFYVSDAENLRIQQSDRPIAADSRQRPILEYDF